MSACIIEKKDLERLGKKLMKEFYDHVHSKYFLNRYEEVILKRKFYDENLTKEFLSFHKEEEKTFGNLYFNNKRYEDLVKMKTKKLLSKIETKIKDETLDIEIIFNFLSKMDNELKYHIRDKEREIDEDLFFMKKAFLNMFEVFHNDHDYLKK